MRQAIIFQGPPHAGKDTAAQIICSRHPHAEHMKFSWPLKEGVRAIFNLSDVEMRQLEAQKGHASELLFGETFRRMQIALSEDFMKPRFGAQVFGHLVARRMRQNTNPNTLFVFSDGGFPDELIPVAAEVGRKNMLIVQIEREGKDFSNDSRGYCTLDEVKIVRIRNPGDATYEGVVVETVQRWLMRNG